MTPLKKFSIFIKKATPCRLAWHQMIAIRSWWWWDESFTLKRSLFFSQGSHPILFLLPRTHKEQDERGNHTELLIHFAYFFMVGYQAKGLRIFFSVSSNALFVCGKQIFAQTIQLSLLCYRKVIVSTDKRLFEKYFPIKADRDGKT